MELQRYGGAALCFSGKVVISVSRAPNEKAAKAKKLFESGMKLVEIAAQLGVPDGTVRRWKSTGAWGSERSDKGERSGKKASVRKTPPPEVVSVMKNPDLTDSQRLFCLYYSRSFNATRSYQKAYGCSYAVANAEGPALLVKPSVREEITRLKQMRYGKALLEPEDLFQKYMDIAFADLTDYVSFGQVEQPVMAMYGPVMVPDPDTGEKVPLTKLVNAVRLTESDQVDGSILSEVSQGRDGAKIKLSDRMRALQWLTDHMELATPEQQARIDNLRASTAKLRGAGPDGGPEDDGFLDALRAEADKVWQP